jgi:hypothetical protein
LFGCEISHFSNCCDLEAIGVESSVGSGSYCEVVYTTVCTSILDQDSLGRVIN